MRPITFKDIYYRGQIVFENDLFLHKHTAEMLLLYDGNFLQFKKMPSLTELQDAAAYLRDYHVKKGQDHVKLLFPENETIPGIMVDFLKTSGYDIGFMELYAIKPTQFPVITPVSNILVKKVMEETLSELYELRFEMDAEISERFASQKKYLHEQNFTNERFLQVIAYYDNKPVGTVDVIVGEDTAEIDGLIVLDPYQKKGIGSQIQKYVMEEFQDKTVILIADGEDTPKEMYKKQNYEFQGMKYEALKVFK
jgi:GNAT superfamily N-acetyltransferase